MDIQNTIKMKRSPADLTPVGKVLSWKEGDPTGEPLFNGDLAHYRDGKYYDDEGNELTSVIIKNFKGVKFET